jgi:hypothetical protein
MSDAVGLMFLGSVLLVIGVVSVIQKRFTLPFGRIGTIKPKPVFIFVLTESRATRFGFTSLVCGLFMIGLGLHTYITFNMTAITDGILTITIIVGVAITIFVFLFELFMEFLVDLRKKAMSKEGENGKHSDSANNSEQINTRENQAVPRPD